MIDENSNLQCEDCLVMIKHICGLTECKEYCACKHRVISYYPDGEAYASPWQEKERRKK